MAADSLTSLKGRVVSCTTQKLHKVGHEAVTAGCGLARPAGQSWSHWLANFPVAPVNTSFNTVTSDLQTYLDGVIGQVPRSNYNACQGGNEFLLAGYNAAAPGLEVAFLERRGDRRQFEQPTLASAASNDDYIKWLGDTQKIPNYINQRTALYTPGMTQTDAVTFAVNAIIAGILASQAANNQTIGGDFVSVAVVSAGSCAFSQYQTNIPCQVTPPVSQTGSSGVI